MSRRRTLPRAGILIAQLCVGVALAADAPRILSPKSTDILVGQVEFALEPPDTDTPVDRIDLFVEGRLIGSAHAPDWAVTWDVGDAGARFKVLAVAYANARIAGRLEREFRGAAIHEREYVDLVQLYPVVTTITGEYVTGLKREDFRVFDEGQEVEVEHFASTVSSLSIVLLLDVSESMSGKLGYVQVAASDFIDGLGEYDEVALYTFDHATRMINELTVDHETVKRNIWELSPGGGTALYDAIIKVTGDSLRDVPGRKALFVFSDGLDQHSFASVDAAVKGANDQNAIVYAVGSGDEEQGTMSREDLETLARRSGGKAFFIRRPRDLDGVFEKVLEDLRSQYVIAYRPPDGASGTRRIRVEAPGRVRHRRSYDYVSHEP